MKTKKKKRTSIMEPKVVAYERAQEKLRAAFETVNKLQDDPAVKLYLVTREKAAKPVQSEQERKKSELGDLYDKFKLSEAYLNETLELLQLVSGHKLDLPNLGSTLDKMGWEFMNISEVVNQAFALNGIRSTEKEEAAA